ncbi:hypothetical protein ARMGADRAFT_753762 [Armillaria gallica]|uniref:F-box domain-containing protein n=1 Tax=Armillaria gallica TaxID=47427 RepID=A0A2H3DL39_ARMGA|nr:hypothetical protein ARMGADRAFT_753762 [Armillaria gallica]
MVRSSFFSFVQGGFATDCHIKCCPFLGHPSSHSSLRFAPWISTDNMVNPQPSTFQVSNGSLSYWPYSTLSTNYGLPYTCHDLYTRLLDVRSSADIFTPEFISISIERLGPPNGPSDPALPALLTALSEHEDLSSLFLHNVNWAHFASRHLWHSSIIAFSNITYLTMTETSLQVNEFCSLIRSFPLHGLEVHSCLTTGDFQAHPLSMDAHTIILNQQGPEIQYLDITVCEGSNILDIFTQLWSPVSFSKLEKLSISGRGGGNVGQQIVRLIEISIPLDLNINCEGFDLAPAPPISNLCEVTILVITIPLDGANDVRRTNDCLRWWTSSLKRIPRQNNIAYIHIDVIVDQPSIAYLPLPKLKRHSSGGMATAWIYFDEALSDNDKFRLNRRFGVTVLRKQNTARPFNTQGYYAWIRSDALAECFEHHLGISLRRHA